MRFRNTATSQYTASPDPSTARLSLARLVVLVVGLLSLIAFGTIGVVVTRNIPPDTSSTAALSIERDDWHGVPLCPCATFLRNLTPDSSQYTVTADAATVTAWFEREWPQIGLTYRETSARNGTTFRLFETKNHIFGYTIFGYNVTETSPGNCTVTLIRDY
ncbi:MAG: hypothetical protein U0841_11590 [Chloroflexia bacterium]